MMEVNSYYNAFEIENATLEINQSVITERYDNETHMNYCPYVKSPISNMILMLLYGFVGVVGVCGNSLVIFVVFKFK